MYQIIIKKKDKRFIDKLPKNELKGFQRLLKNFLTEKISSHWRETKIEVYYALELEIITLFTQ